MKDTEILEEVQKKTQTFSENKANIVFSVYEKDRIWLDHKGCWKIFSAT